MTITPSALVRLSLFSKTNQTFSSVARNTSCSRGWLHLVVQMTFGAITVASFILIMLMTFQWTRYTPTPCNTVSCRITCSDGPYKESDIITAIMAADSGCDLILTLRDPIFKNGIMPEHWLDNVPYFIETLSIVGGNLQHIANNAFMSQFVSNLKILMLENITISSWTSDTLIGLAELNFLRIVNCELISISQDAIRAVDNTIRTLTVTGSGIWNPAQITGSGPNSLTKLTVVNFSFNNFGNILGASSFTGLEYCNDLYLNSCGITSIEEGAFDSLTNIDMLFLNDNFLITLPPGLFNNILLIQSNVTPRINLQNNFWQCDCTQNEIMRLSNKGLLLVDPSCYHPLSLNGIPISGLEQFCSNKTEEKPDNSSVETLPYINYESEMECFYGTQVMSNMSFKVISPLTTFKCPLSSVINFDRQLRSTLEETMIVLSNSSWLRPEFLLRYNSFSMMQIGATVNDSVGYGLLWYQSDCPNELYCFNILPEVLRIYNINHLATYTFCPVNLNSAQIEIEQCMNYNMSYYASVPYVKYTRPLMYATTGILCLVFGAVVVYGMIRMNPYLLKGSKRLLFVKHRSVDALVLPPKIPLRTSLSKEALDADDKKIYTMFDDTNLLYPCNLVRSDSVKSDKSSSPTYISAMQPTEAQLAEWRLRHHFDKNISITSITSEKSMCCWVCDNNICCTKVPYENFK